MRDVDELAALRAENAALLDVLTKLQATDCTEGCATDTWQTLIADTLIRQRAEAPEPSSVPPSPSTSGEARAR